MVLNTLIGKRFSTTTEIENHLQELGAPTPSVYKSESQMTPDQDFMLDGTMQYGSDNDDQHFTLFYLLDRQGNYYITEANFWA